MSRVFLVDGTGLLYRAHFAFLRNPLVTKKGEVVSAVYGFAHTLHRLLRDEKPDYLGVAFDLGAPTFRHERYAAYKANRPPMPSELIAQGGRAREIVHAFGCCALERAGVEADDWIGTFARQGRAAGHEVVIVSADKDFMQLVGDGIRQLIPPRASEPAQWIDRAEVRAKWSVDPEQMIDLLALMGDSSDNVPGVPGVGEKTAAKLLGSFHTLDELYARLDEVTPAGVKEKLVRGRESAYLSRELVSIETELESPWAFEQLAVPPFGTRPELRPLLEELEFRRLLEGLPPAAKSDARDRVDTLDACDAPDTGDAADGWRADYRALTTLLDLDQWLDGYRAAGGPLALDTETTSLDARRAAIVGISLAYREGDAVYLPLGHDAGPNLPLPDVVARLRTLLEEEAVELIGQNCKYDLHVLRTLGLSPKGALRDTLLASYLLDPEGTHNLDTLSRELLEHEMIPITALIGEGKTQVTMNQIDVARVAEYAAEDADCALRLEGIFRQKLGAAGLLPIWRELECPLVPVLLEMERSGVRIDVPYLGVLSREMESRLAALTEEIERAAECEFNIASPAQLAKVLFDQLGLPKKKKTKTGWSTDQEVLEELASLHPVPRLVLEHRLLSKLKGTYVDALPAMVDPETGRIHSTFNQTVAATGRLSSMDPNIQNIPIRSAEGRRIRRAFVAEDGHLLLCADYSQIELRILAHLADDPGLVAAFREGRDIHAATAERLFGVRADQVGVELRSRAKTVNFGVIYGMGAQRLARELGISFAEAKSFIDEYFAKMPAVKGYLEDSLRKARGDGYVTTLFGRRRLTRGLNSGDPRIRSQTERIVANTPIQGAAADVIKRAMLRVHAALAHEGLKARMVMQVHDELVLEVAEHELARAERLLVSAMEGAAELSVPLKIDVGSGRNWAEAKE